MNKNEKFTKKWCERFNQNFYIETSMQKFFYNELCKMLKELGFKVEEK